MLTDPEYVEIKGSRCPFCGSEDIEGAHMEVEEGGATQEVSCLKCHMAWLDCYALTGYIVTRPPKLKSEEDSHGE